VKIVFTLEADEETGKAIADLIRHILSALATKLSQEKA